MAQFVPASPLRDPQTAAVAREPGTQGRVSADDFRPSKQAHKDQKQD